MRQLLDAGIHFGHQSHRWNPKMKKYIFGKRDSIHIIDLTQTLELTKSALEKICEIGKEVDILVTKEEVIEYLETVDDEATKLWLIKARGGL